MSEDVVAELDRYLNDTYTLDITIQRARDEIVALRAFKARVFADVRDAALEEAARLCERVPGDPQHGDFFAAAIRALKDKGHD